jgi:hypothetical protein
MSRAYMSWDLVMDCPGAIVRCVHTMISYMITVVLCDGVTTPVEALPDLRRDVGQPEGLLQCLLRPLVVGCRCLYTVTEMHGWKKAPPCLCTIMSHITRTHKSTIWTGYKAVTTGRQSHSAITGCDGQLKPHHVAAVISAHLEVGELVTEACIDAVILLKGCRRPVASA